MSGRHPLKSKPHIEHGSRQNWVGRTQRDLRSGRRSAAESAACFTLPSRNVVHRSRVSVRHADQHTFENPMKKERSDKSLVGLAGEYHVLAQFAERGIVGALKGVSLQHDCDRSRGKGAARDFCGTKRNHVTSWKSIQREVEGSGTSRNLRGGDLRRRSIHRCRNP